MRATIILHCIAALSLPGAGCAEPCLFDEDGGADLSALCTFVDHPKNPLIQPPAGQTLLGDPTVVPPAESPDGRWHLFANSMGGIHHHVSSDGVSWTLTGAPLFEAMAFRAFVFREAGVYYLFYEQFTPAGSTIKLSQSKDLSAWSTPVDVLKPEQTWEQEGSPTVGNAYLTKVGAQYRLYYSAGTVWLADTVVLEPRHIGLATASAPTGPFVKRAAPIISPDAADPLRNKGAGSIKLLDHRMGGRFLALSNGIYEDSAGKSGSAIMVLQSDDGVSWRKVCPGAVIAPTGGGTGWKAAFVYAFDTTVVGSQLWAYYNGRDGWAGGHERIGLSTCELGCTPP